jgi:hypothetical protein
VQRVEISLHVLVDPTFTHLIGVNLNKRVMPALHLDRERHGTKRTRKGTRTRIGAPARKAKGAEKTIGLLKHRVR